MQFTAEFRTSDLIASSLPTSLGICSYEQRSIHDGVREFEFSCMNPNKILCISREVMLVILV